jgi:hypothetical protein
MSTLTHSYTTRSFVGVIREVNGKRIWEPLHPLWYQTELRKFKPGEKVSCVYTSKKPKRTESQNRYYWGVYLPLIAEETGNEIEDLHNLFKGKFLNRGIVEVLGSKVRRILSTTDLTTSQFIEYIMKIEEFTGVLAPPTDEYVYGEKSLITQS